MKGKKKIIIYGVLLILLILALVACFFLPKVEIILNGSNNISFNVNEEYVDLGAKAFVKTFFSKKEIDVKTKGNVNTKEIGVYKVNYEASYIWIHKTESRSVKVADLEAPKITLNKKVNYCKINNIVDIDATAIDNYDGDISQNIKYQVEGKKVKLFIEDTEGNVSELVEELNEIDSEKPIINLNGESKIYLKLNDKYEEQGATAKDSCDGNITDKIEVSGEVNTTELGTYEIFYTVTDSFGNKIEKRRIVIVSEDEADLDNYKVINGAHIYLTFDDGPGIYTEEILNVLKKYDIKATFFVTNQFPKYQYLIKKEYDEGHTIGVHTYSHKWSVYDSVESYLADFNSIQEVIVNQTGVKTKYFRFPGGSSNTVSINHSKGIVTHLAELMEKNGYTYYDWHIDSGDTHKNNTPEYIINTVKRQLKGDGEYIILMHDIKKNTLDALPTIIEYALTHGYEFKKIDDSTPVKHSKIAN